MIAKSDHKQFFSFAFTNLLEMTLQNSRYLHCLNRLRMKNPREVTEGSLRGTERTRCLDTEEARQQQMSSKPATSQRSCKSGIQRHVNAVTAVTCRVLFAKGCSYQTASPSPNRAILWRCLSLLPLIRDVLILDQGTGWPQSLTLADGLHQHRAMCSVEMGLASSSRLEPFLWQKTILCESLFQRKLRDCIWLCLNGRKS